MTTHTRSAIACLSLGILGSLLLAGCQSPDVEKLRLQGIQEYREQRYIESTATLRYALNQNPSDAPSAYYMGLNYRAVATRKFGEGDIPGARRELDTAVVWFNQAIKHWPNYQAAVQAKTEALELRGKYERALDTADTVAEHNKGRSLEHIIFAGDQYRDVGDYDSAMDRYLEALASDPNNAKVYASMGKLYTMTGDREKAIGAYERAHQLDPGNTEVTEQMARLGIGESPTNTVIRGQP